jgi:hypothetical protein
VPRREGILCQVQNRSWSENGYRSGWRANDSEPPWGIEPRPTHYERVQWTMVSDGWCCLTLGYSRESVAGDGR